MDALLSLIWIIVKIVAIVLPLMLGVAYATYAERKIIGFMQDRIGPNRVGIKGLGQPIADGLKLFMKEIIVPSTSNHYLFLVAPILSIAPALAAWMQARMQFSFEWLFSFGSCTSAGPRRTCTVKRLNGRVAVSGVGVFHSGMMTMVGVEMVTRGSW